MASELDADLYGDLYGNDETDVAPAQDSQDYVKEEDSTSAEHLPEPSPKPIASAVPASAPIKQQSPAPAPIPSFTSQPQQQHQPQDQYMHDQGADTNGDFQQYQEIPTYSSQPQSIPTYQQEDDGSDLANGYNRQRMPERSVRPSEMKDEG
ncbi:hypothetical protein CONPUDRAFT_81499 [Coniophora puteana RWD-64-598 SS2]|uniref:Uncharacterized protein n=1 Tax=Coniophora puteana (strain RWD-64-598) TaxID=741705 RepID=A0A5M3MRH3_CONPW|nr:uncharacterized protein CONPUDRAFT_81499 [Coniophora puteana RWD-64-598 SS2]EIW81758.1 hypothetical protein CONPUDRAFT_81499 [Coniophora puteana RWD-64-598 SS2]